MALQIIVKKAYFDNIKIVIDAVNNFFSSKFQSKDFPSIDSEADVDYSVTKIVSYLNSIEPSWIDNPDKVESFIEYINQKLQKEDNDDENDENQNMEINSEEDLESLGLSQQINAFVGYKVLQRIADNFQLFSELMNGIYTFELFLQPSKYQKAIERFSLPIDITELSLPSDMEYNMFSVEDYVNGIQSNREYITLPAKFNAEEEIERINSFTDSDTMEIVVDDTDEEQNYDSENGELPTEQSPTTESFYIREAAEVNMFKDDKPSHIKYDESSDKFEVSQQLKSAIDKITDELEKVDDAKGIKEVFETNLNDATIKIMFENMVPFILVRALTSPKKFSKDISSQTDVKKYTESYDSIVSKNKGSERFYTYDIFSTFKVDKSGTIKFIKDFMTCDLYNKPNTTIKNYSMRAIFNIFDSRIYFDKLYNLIPEKVKKDKYPSEDEFVKKSRARLNKASHDAKPYEEKDKDESKPKTTSEVQEFVHRTIKHMKDCTISDVQNADIIQEMVKLEVSHLEDYIYNAKISPIAFNMAIQEQLQFIINEMEDGEMPDYMKDRIRISDTTADDITVTPADNYSSMMNSVPNNSFDDLTTSIDSKINSFYGDDVDSMLGTGYEERKSSNDGKIVYNITNNYTNSFNKNSNNTQNDTSSGKSVNVSSTRVNSPGDPDDVKIPPHQPQHIENKSMNKAQIPNSSNNSNNDSHNSVTDPKVSDDESNENTLTKSMFSNGMNIKEFFDMLTTEAAEPLSVGMKKEKQQQQLPDMNDSPTSADKKFKKVKIKDKAVKTFKNITSSVKNTKSWMIRTIDDLNKKDEYRVKAELMEKPGYRTNIYKVARTALKLGTISVSFALSPWLGFLATAHTIIRDVDKQDNMRKEFQSEMVSELKILDTKIARCKEKAESSFYTKAERDAAIKELEKLTRLRPKYLRWIGDSSKQNIATPNNSFSRSGW